MVDGFQIRGTTRLMGIIGDPIAQAKTPATINTIFSAGGVDIACVPIHVPVQELETVWAGLKGMPNLIGFGITLPHKQTALELCDSLDPLVKRVGAVNVVRRERDGSFRGYQFDGKGFVRGLRANSIVIETREVLLLGAGGAAVAIAFALVEAGAKSVTIANRTTEKAQVLADTVNADFGRIVAKVGPAKPTTGQLVINATSLGLNDQDALPLDPDLLRPGMTMAEVIAQPETTRLLAEAAARDVETHSGIHMIKGQVGLIADHMCDIWG
ncbi:shikimate dehydrogenase family protein [Sinorhizobium meliloti]|uniref:shikimate dehydrogenase family protein n=1 Tax=Rhizobium meliloti TaxID=382 RepID=UPI000FDB5CC4|nr:shikimate dehydrogenase [Sinorhizobium meliloti]MDE3775537.1 shikimate dehydrogenase [Sinorhizobium meliloti]RVG96850.1 shikimate dehydrogenase [Sinorhizobium meliloti]RVK64705.1 shikimate dehydrogenase [Sinorhizobium meliloti]